MFQCSAHCHHFLFKDENAVWPFLTQAPFDIVSNESYQNNFDTLYSSSPLVSSSSLQHIELNAIIYATHSFICILKEVALTDEGQNPALLKPFDEMFEIQLPLEMARIDFNSEVGLEQTCLFVNIESMSLFVNRNIKIFRTEIEDFTSMENMLMQIHWTI